ncbi:MAG TPA: GIY-YIG nuclease family protein [Candidatus Binataceae bacterium]|nr:GIY-YIG nuclease family protein [Candidatus Binataceae bacterium]
MPPREPRTYYTYIMGSRSGVIYIGITSNLMARVCQHKTGVVPGFTSRYRVTRLLLFEEFGHPTEAIEREKELKGWLRAKKLNLVRSKNPKWEDLSADWF